MLLFYETKLEREQNNLNLNFVSCKLLIYLFTLHSPHLLKFYLKDTCFEMNSKGKRKKVQTDRPSLNMSKYAFLNLSSFFV